MSERKVSEHMSFLLNNSFGAALKRIAELEADHDRLEKIDEPAFAPNIRLDGDDQGRACWKVDDECFPTLRAALDSITEEES